MSEGQGVVAGHGRRAEDDASILWVLLKHLLSLLSSHIKKAAGGLKEKEKESFILC